MNRSLVLSILVVCTGVTVVSAGVNKAAITGRVVITKILTKERVTLPAYQLRGVSPGPQEPENRRSGALSGDPFAWYWGHSHLGVVYKAPGIANQPGSSTFSRCLGHGALPYGDASELHGAPWVDWYAHTPQPSGKQVYNGFVLLTLQSANGQVTSVNEGFYDLGSTAPAWSKALHL